MNFLRNDEKENPIVIMNERTKYKQKPLLHQEQQPAWLLDDVMSGTRARRGHEQDTDRI